ncbi:hypothetical protein RCL1_008453 [Eukaryota sp. TZLM3-RCL]
MDFKDVLRDPLIRQFFSRYGKNEWNPVMKLLLKYAIGSISSEHPLAVLSTPELEEITREALENSPFDTQPCSIQFSKPDASWRDAVSAPVAVQEQHQKQESVIQKTHNKPIPASVKKPPHSTAPKRAPRESIKQRIISSTNPEPQRRRPSPTSAESSVSAQINHLQKSKWFSAFSGNFDWVHEAEKAPDRSKPVQYVPSEASETYSEEEETITGVPNVFRIGTPSSRFVDDSISVLSQKTLSDDDFVDVG